MVRYVYVDVLLGLNFAVNYLLSVLTVRYLQIRVSPLRLFAFVGVGALYSTVCVVGQWHAASGHLGQLVLTVALLRILLPISTWHTRGKVAATFTLLSWMVAGAAYALHHMQPPLFAVRWWVPLIAVGVTALPAGLAWQALLTQRWEEKHCVRVTVVVGEKTAGFVAFLDTGNQLADPLTGLPVIVAEKAALWGVLEENTIWAATNLQALLDAKAWHDRLHVIPYRSVGTEEGMLVGFRPDEIWVHSADGMHRCGQAVVAVYGSTLSTGGGYQAIAPPALMRAA